MEFHFEWKEEAMIESHEIILCWTQPVILRIMVENTN